MNTSQQGQSHVFSHVGLGSGFLNLSEISDYKTLILQTNSSMILLNLCAWEYCTKCQHTSLFVQNKKEALLFAKRKTKLNLFY